MGAQNRRKLLLLTRNFPPLVGGMERLVHRAFEALQGHYEVSLVGPDGCDDYVMQAHYIDSFCLRPTWKSLTMATAKARRAVLLQQPDIVLCGSGLMAPVANLALAGKSAKRIVMLHGLDIVADSVIYQHVFVPAIRRFDTCIVNSRNTGDLAVKHGVAASRIELLHPGVDPVQRAGLEAGLFRARHGLGDRPILLCVGRLTRRKGVLEFIEHALAEVVRVYPDAILVVIGGEASNALNTQLPMGDAIRQAAQARDLSANVRLVGEVSEAELREAYQDASLMIFPVLDLPGDVEGFGMVAVEAAAWGLATVGFAVGGVPDAVQEGNTGLLVAAGDYAGFAAATVRLLRRSAAEVQRMSNACANFADRLSWPNYADRLLDICERSMQAR